MKTPIIPTKLIGLDVTFKNANFPKFHKSQVIFGKPIMPNEFKNMSFEKAAKIIHSKVEELKI